MKIQVSEKRVEQAIQLYNQYGEEIPENFARALELGKMFRDADLHPFYIFDDEANVFLVTSEEHVDNMGN